MFEIKLDKDVNISLKTHGLEKHLVINFENGTAPVPPTPEPGPEPAPIDPEPTPTPEPEPTQYMFAEDYEETPVQSTVEELNIPKGLSNLFDIEYAGAFRVAAKNNVSSSNYAVGALGFNPERNSLYLAGHAHHGAIAEFRIPNELSFESDVKEIVNAICLQNYAKAVMTGGQSDNMRVTGMLVHDGKLLLNSNVWYDGGGKNKRHMQIFDADNIAAGSDGYLSVTGDAKAAGYMSEIPEHLQDDFSATHFMGWASNYSITSRYSQGPSLYTFDPDQAILANENVDGIAKLVYPFGEGKNLVPGSSDYDQETTRRSQIWSSASKALFAFIPSDSEYLVIVGSNGGINSGIGYKIKRSDGRTCSGGCTFDLDDSYNYFWIYKISDILEATEPHQAKPISCGKWSHPFDKGGKRKVIGADFDRKNNRFYLTLSGAGQVGEYDRPPLIIAYNVRVKK